MIYDRMQKAKAGRSAFTWIFCGTLGITSACSENSEDKGGGAAMSSLGTGGTNGTSMTLTGGSAGTAPFGSGGASGTGALTSGGAAGAGPVAMGGAAGAGIAGDVGAGGIEPQSGGNGGTLEDAGVAGAPPMSDASSGGASNPPEGVNVAVEGPYAFDTFTEGADAPEYAEGLVYHPTDAPSPFAMMLLSPGLTASNTDYEVWGRVLASHGIAALLIQPTSTLDWNDLRAVDLEAALGVVEALNQSGRLAGKIDTENVGFMGQSMGGGGTLIAANKLGNRIRAAIPMQPYAPGASFPNITAPTLIIAAELDTVATVSSNAFAHYRSIPETTKKIFLEGAGKDHYFSTDRFENDFEINARYAVAFLKLYLEGDTRYETYLYGAEHEAYQAGKLSRYLSPLLP